LDRTSFFLWFPNLGKQDRVRISLTSYAADPSQATMYIANGGPTQPAKDYHDMAGQMIWIPHLQGDVVWVTCDVPMNSRFVVTAGIDTTHYTLIARSPINYLLFAEEFGYYSLPIVKPSGAPRRSNAMFIAQAFDKQNSRFDVYASCTTNTPNPQGYTWMVSSDQGAATLMIWNWDPATVNCTRSWYWSVYSYVSMQFSITATQS